MTVEEKPSINTKKTKKRAHGVHEENRIGELPCFVSFLPFVLFVVQDFRFCTHRMETSA